MTNEQVKHKLKLIKALVDRGVGGEKEQALELYKKLLAKYEISEDEIISEKIKRVWMRYDDDIDKKLITRIFYYVTGSSTYFIKNDKRRRLVGIDCTEFEQDQIVFLYQFYRKHLDNELDIFMDAFIIKNNLFPDDTVRVKEDKHDNNKNFDLARSLKIRMMAEGIDKKIPNKQINSEPKQLEDKG